MLCMLAVGFVHAQGSPSGNAQQSGKTPQIKLNFLNVCSPTPDEAKEFTAALNKVPAKVNYSGDFEVTRGRLVSEKEKSSKYVRLRRELENDPTFSNIQFSLSADEKNITETLVFKVKDPKDLVLISIEDQMSATAAKPSAALDADTPATHIKLERFGKQALALARCENRDQSEYEPIFTLATKTLADYRKALGLRTMFRSDLTWLAQPAAPKEKITKSAPKAAETNSKGKHLN